MTGVVTIRPTVTAVLSRLPAAAFGTIHVVLGAAGRLVFNEDPVNWQRPSASSWRYPGSLRDSAFRVPCLLRGGCRVVLESPLRRRAQ